MRRRIAVLVISMLTVVACHDDGGGGSGAGSSAETNRQWCQSEWDDGLGPKGWDHDKLMQDCLDGLEVGYTREEIHAIYREMKLNNK